MLLFVLLVLQGFLSEQNDAVDATGDWILTTILKPAKMLRDVNWCYTPEPEKKKFDSASTTGLHKHRLFCSYASHILLIYQSHGFYVKAPLQTKAKNEILYNWLRKDLGKNRKLSRATTRGHTTTNIPIVLCLIAYLVNNKVLTVSHSWAVNQKTRNVLNRIRDQHGNFQPYRKWYSPKFKFKGDTREFTLINVFNILVFGTTETFPNRKNGESLKDDVYQTISNAESKVKNVDALISELEETYEVKAASASKQDTRFINSADVKSLKLSGMPLPDMKAMLGYGKKLLAHAALVGVNTEMFRKCNQDNLERGSLEGEEIEEVQKYDTMYLKGGTKGGKKSATEEPKKKRKAETVEFPVYVCEGIVNHLEKEMRMLMKRLQRNFLSKSFLSYEETWRDLVDMTPDQAHATFTRAKQDNHDTLKLVTVEGTSWADHFQIPDEDVEQFNQHLTTLVERYKGKTNESTNDSTNQAGETREAPAVKSKPTVPETGTSDQKKGDKREEQQREVDELPITPEKKSSPTSPRSDEDKTPKKPELTKEEKMSIRKQSLLEKHESSDGDSDHDQSPRRRNRRKPDRLSPSPASSPDRPSQRKKKTKKRTTNDDDDSEPEDSGGKRKASDSSKGTPSSKKKARTKKVA